MLVKGCSNLYENAHLFSRRRYAEYNKLREKENNKTASGLAPSEGLGNPAAAFYDLSPAVQNALPL